MQALLEDLRKQIKTRRHAIISSLLAPILVLACMITEAQSAPTGSAPVVIDPPRNTNGPVVSVADFGANVSSNDNYQAFSNAIAHCRQTSASRLVMPKGTYRFAQKRRIAFDGLKDIEIDGQGSDLIFSDLGFIQIVGCTRTVIGSFSLDWDWNKEPLAYIGKVINVEPNFLYVDFQFPQVSDISANIKWPVIEPVDPDTYTPGVQDGWESWYLAIDKVEKLQSNVLRMYPNARSSFHVQVGQVWRIRQYVYDCHAVIMGANTNLAIQNVTIYSAPGMGFVGGGAMHHMQFLGCKIVPRPGQIRPITTCADGLHIGDSQGYVNIENCEFTLMGDDAINIHDSFSMGITPVDANTLVALNVIPWLHKYAAGDTIELRNPDYSPVGYTAKLTAAGSMNDGTCRMTFDTPLPGNLNTNTIIFDRSYGSTNIIIRNNYFHEHRARGMLVKFSDGLIEGNRLYKTSGNAISIETGPPEGTLPRNLIFRNNTIEKCNLMNWGDGVINTDIYGIPEKNSSYRVFEDILFERNTLAYNSNPACKMYFYDCGNVTFASNIFTLSKVPAESGAGAIYVKQATDVTLAGNIVLNASTSSALVSIGSNVTGLVGNDSSGIRAVNLPAGFVGDAVYRLTPKVNTASALDVNGASTNNGAQVDEWNWDGDANQLWQIADVGDGSFNLVPQHATSSALDVNGSGTTNGTKIQIWAANGGDNQEWVIEDMGTGWCRLMPKCAIGSCMNVNGGGTTNGTLVSSWQNIDGSVNQLWQLTASWGNVPGEVRISTSEDDAEERTDTHAVSLTSTDLELTFDSGNGYNQIVGMRFPGIAIPRGARIGAAWLQFGTDETNNMTPSLVIQAQASDNAPAFSASSGNISARTRTVAAIDWTPPAWLTVGEAGINQRSPDIASVIQEVVDRSGWTNGNAIAIIVSGTGQRIAESYDGAVNDHGNPAFAPLLHIECSSGTSSNASPLVSITSPTNDATFAAGTNIVITASASDSDGTLLRVEFYQNGDLMGQTATAPYSCTWSNVSAGNYPLTAIAYDNGGAASTSSVVNIIVTNAVTGGTGVFTNEARVAASGDDARENVSNGAVKISSRSLDMVDHPTDGNQLVGFRFPGLTAPQGATITLAYVQFTSYAGSTNVASFTIKAEAADNAQPFTTNVNNISSRTRTTSSVTWNPADWTGSGLSGSDQRTPNLSAVIQDVVNRSGWVSGNAVALIFTGTGQRVVCTYDGGGSSSGALLHVEYSVGSTNWRTKTSHGVLYTWLNSEGITNDYEQADVSDPDGDGMPTWEEYYAGTCPTNKASVFRILALSMNPVITWCGTTNSGVTNGFRMYRSTDLLVGGSWTVVASNLMRSASGTNTWTDPSPPLSGSIYYRLDLPVPEQ